MSRWDSYPASNGANFIPMQADTGAVYQTTSGNIFYQPSGQVVRGSFLRSEPDGISGLVRCYYQESNTISCEATPGCCTNGCCPKDWILMGGLYILIAFVVVFVVIAILIAVVCYSRSKKQQHKEEQLASNYAYSNYGGSQVGYPKAYSTTDGYGYAPPPPQSTYAYGTGPYSNGYPPSVKY